MKKEIIVGTILCMALPTCVWGRAVPEIMRKDEFSFRNIIGMENLKDEGGFEFTTAIKLKKKINENKQDKNLQLYLYFNSQKAYIGKNEFNTLNGNINLFSSFSTIPHLYECAHKCILSIFNEEERKNFFGNAANIIRENSDKPGLINSTLLVCKLVDEGLDLEEILNLESQISETENDSEIEGKIDSEIREKIAKIKNANAIKDVETARKWLERKGLLAALPKGQLEDRIYDLLIYLNGEYFKNGEFFIGSYGKEIVKRKKNYLEQVMIHDEEEKRKLAVQEELNIINTLTPKEYKERILEKFHNVSEANGNPAEVVTIKQLWNEFYNGAENIALDEFIKKLCAPVYSGDLSSAWNNGKDGIRTRNIIGIYIAKHFLNNSSSYLNNTFLKEEDNLSPKQHTLRYSEHQAIIYFIAYIHNLATYISTKIIPQEILAASYRDNGITTINFQKAIYHFKTLNLYDSFQEVNTSEFNKEVFESKKDSIETPFDKWLNETKISTRDIIEFIEIIISELFSAINFDKTGSKLDNTASNFAHNLYSSSGKHFGSDHVPILTNFFCYQIIPTYIHLRFKELFECNKNNIWKLKRSSSNKKMFFDTFILGNYWRGTYNSSGEYQITKGNRAFSLLDKPDNIFQKIKNTSFGKRLFTDKMISKYIIPLENQINEYFEIKSDTKNHIVDFVKRIIYCNLLDKLKIGQKANIRKNDILYDFTEEFRKKDEETGQKRLREFIISNNEKNQKKELETEIALKEKSGKQIIVDKAFSINKELTNLKHFLRYYLNSNPINTEKILEYYFNNLTNKLKELTSKTTGATYLYKLFSLYDELKASIFSFISLDPGYAYDKFSYSPLNLEELARENIKLQNIKILAKKLDGEDLFTTKQTEEYFKAVQGKEYSKSKTYQEEQKNSATKVVTKPAITVTVTQKIISEADEKIFYNSYIYRTLYDMWDNHTDSKSFISRLIETYKEYRDGGKLRSFIASVIETFTAEGWKDFYYFVEATGTDEEKINTAITRYENYCFKKTGYKNINSMMNFFEIQKQEEFEQLLLAIQDNIKVPKAKNGEEDITLEQKNAYDTFCVNVLNRFNEEYEKLEGLGIKLKTDNPKELFKKHLQTWSIMYKNRPNENWLQKNVDTCVFDLMCLMLYKNNNSASVDEDLLKYILEKDITFEEAAKEITDYLLDTYKDDIKPAHKSQVKNHRIQATCENTLKKVIEAYKKYLEGSKRRVQTVIAGHYDLDKIKDDLKQAIDDEIAKRDSSEKVEDFLYTSTLISGNDETDSIIGGIIAKTITNALKIGNRANPKK